MSRGLNVPPEQAYQSMVNRFEHLKRAYFQLIQRREPTDEDGQPIPSMYTVESLVTQFRNMGVMVPSSPSDTMKPLPTGDGPDAA